MNNNITHIRSLLIGVWRNPENGNTWFFSDTYIGTHSYCFLKQNSPKSYPIKFMYKVIEENDNFYLEIDEQKLKLLSINSEELIFIKDHIQVRLLKYGCVE